MTEQIDMQRNNRIVYLDLLRIAATFIVMMLHYKTFWAVAFILIFGALAYGEVKRWLTTK